MSEAFVWCTHCGDRLTEAQATGISCCPTCGSKGTPCDPKEDFLVEVNWHELRILGIWASNWAEKHCDRSAQNCVASILGRLERQAPGSTPLSLGGEIRSLRIAAAKGELPISRIEAPGVADAKVVRVAGPGAVGFSRRPTPEPQSETVAVAQEGKA